MFVIELTAAFVVLRTENLHTWSRIHLPGILWVNTGVLLLSSVTLEMARRRLSMDDATGFRRMWLLTTSLGLLFVGGQAIAWRQLAAEGAYQTSRLASSFFYVFTALHAAHLLGGVCALLYVGLRDFDAGRVTRPVAAEVTSYYWHFMDGLWLFLLALLYFGQ
jgi:cytochrome c oxidase subunit 3